MRIHAVPQRQGALTPHAGRLVRGCEVLAELAGEVLGLPVDTVPVDAETSSTVDGIANRDALVRNRSAQLAALEAPEGKVLTIGGDCAVDLVPVGVARFRYGEGLGAVWFDAHADLNTVASSPSGAYHGMVLRSLFGEGDPDFAAAPALTPGRAVLVGTRAFDPEEARAVESGLAGHVPVAEADPGRVRDAVRATGARALSVHVDLDVLDPGEFGATDYPEPGGLGIAALAAALDGLAALDGVEVVGACVAECVAEDMDQVRPLEPVLAALGRLLRA
ncbi:arginase [Prauserella shujinwangii]|uniref:Arginase n=1 Tax=Prauserella shujinwangii TaxID=1453103 RepID=A0A2T0LWC3_9PSEU|nr:arginase family protein [Prauserella shujinwangii]PRX48326.1 arginase [Prauserella shujinwangii]